MKPVLLRPAMLSDMANIRRFHREQNERDGTNYPLPRIFNPDGTLTPRVPVALVGEKEGVVQQALYAERTAELCFAGCDPRATAFARRDIDGLAWALRILGYGSLYCRVPVQVVKKIRKPLFAAGFEQIDERLVTFHKDLEAT